jgi:hypothetical protein
VKGAVVLALCLAFPAFAAGKKPPQVVHFADVALNKLQVMQLIDQDALVEGPSGDVALVRTGDLVGKEQAKVVGVSKGCVSIKLGRSALSLCAEAPQVPRS